MKISIKEGKLEDHLALLSKEKNAVEELVDQFTQIELTPASNLEADINSIMQCHSILEKIYKSISWRERFLTTLIQKSKQIGREIDDLLSTTNSEINMF